MNSVYSCTRTDMLQLSSHVGWVIGLRIWRQFSPVLLNLPGDAQFKRTVDVPVCAAVETADEQSRVPHTLAQGDFALTALAGPVHIVVVSAPDHLLLPRLGFSSSSSSGSG